MASIPLPALDVQSPDPIRRYQELVAIRGAQQQQAQQAALMPGQLQGQQQQLTGGAQENELRGIQLQNQKMLQKYFAGQGADSSGAQPAQGGAALSYSDMAQQVAKLGPAGLSMSKNLLDLQDLSDKHSESLQKTAANRSDILGLAALSAQGSIKAGIDPTTVVNSMFSNLQNTDPLIAMRLQNDLKARGPQALPQLLSEYQAQSPKVAEMQNAQKVAGIRAPGQEGAEFTAPGPDGQPHRMLPVKQLDGTYKNQDLGPTVETGGQGLDTQEAKAWLARPENKGKDLADFLRYKSTLVPAFNFNLQERGAAPSAAAAAGKTGQDFLSTLNPQRQARVQAIAEGREPEPTGAALRSPFMQSLMNDVYSYDPQFSTQRAQIRKAFTTGSDGKNIGALNTASVHLDALQQAANGLANGSFRPGNQLFNAVQTMFGGAPPTNFDGVKNAVAGEMASALKGSATDQEIHNIAQGIQSQSSPKQLAGFIDSQLHILNQKLQTYKERYEQQIPGDTTWSPVLPQAQAVFQKHGISAGGAQAPPPGPGPTPGQAPPTGNAPTTHNFSLGAWKKANPQGDPKAAEAAAKAAGYQVIN